MNLLAFILSLQYKSVFRQDAMIKILAALKFMRNTIHQHLSNSLDNFVGRFGQVSVLLVTVPRQLDVKPLVFTNIIYCWPFSITEAFIEGNTLLQHASISVVSVQREVNEWLMAECMVVIFPVITHWWHHSLTLKWVVWGEGKLQITDKLQLADQLNEPHTVLHQVFDWQTYWRYVGLANLDVK